MNDSMTRLIKPLITCICAHYRQTNQICSKLFFLNQSKHILIFIQELCMYKTITFYDNSLVLKKISKFFFLVFFSSHPVAYSRPSGRVSAPHRLRTTELEDVKSTTDHMIMITSFITISLSMLKNSTMSLAFSPILPIEIPKAMKNPIRPGT